jgi:hypothetical protein
MDLYRWSWWLLAGRAVELLLLGHVDRSEAPALSGAFRKGRGCVRPVSREQPHAGFQRWRQRRVPTTKSRSSGVIECVFDRKGLTSRA